jgi:hypothetical protein
MKIGVRVEVASMNLRKRRRGGSTTSTNDWYFESATRGT